MSANRRMSGKVRKWDSHRVKNGDNNNNHGARTDQQEVTGSSKDELGLIDDIIGNFGRYQFMIFMFKILIG